MKRVLKTCCVFLVLSALLVSLVGCNTEENLGPTMNPNTVIVPEGDVMFTCGVNLLQEAAPDAFIAAFEEKYPDVTVKKDYNPGNIAARIASGEIGDVFMFNEVEAYNYAITQKALLPLNQFIEPLSIDTSKVYTGVLALGQVEGQLYMVPRDYNHISMIYNKTAVDAAGVSHLVKNGWTWEEFKEACNKVTQFDGEVYTQVGANLNYAWEPVYISFLEGWGGKWFDTEEKKVTLTDELVRKGIEELLSFAETGAIKPEGKGDMSAYVGLKETDYVFRTTVYPDVLARGQEYDTYDLEWDLVTFPALPTHKVGTGCSGFGVYRYTKNPNAAAALALFFFTTEGQYAYHSNYGGSVPLVNELADEGFWRYESTAGTDADWSQKNFDAYVAYPEADTVGRVNCVMPARVASVIVSGWPGMVAEYFNSGDYLNPLTNMQETANQTWARIIASQG